MSLRKAVAQLPQPDFNYISETPVIKMTEHDYVTKQFPEKKSSSHQTLRRYTLAFASFILIVGLGWFYQFGTTASVIDMQVNPSFELHVNRAEKLIAIQAMNEDAKVFLDGRNYKGWDIDKAMSSIVIALADDEFLTEQKNVIHLSVNGVNCANLDERLTNDIKAALLQKGISPNIVSEKTEIDPSKQDERENQSHQSTNHESDSEPEDDSEDSKTDNDIPKTPVCSPTHSENDDSDEDEIDHGTNNDHTDDEKDEPEISKDHPNESDDESDESKEE